MIVATPVRAAGRLLAGVDPALAERLGRVSSTSCAIVSLGYRRNQVAHALDGFGFVVPKVENRQILSGSFSSVKFPGRGPEGMVLLRTFLGGAFHADVLDRDDDELASVAAAELTGLLGIKGEPIVRQISRWPHVMPQYELGHVELVRSIEAAVASHRGLAVAGNAYHGVGVPQCIQSGQQAAERVALGWERTRRAWWRECPADHDFVTRVAVSSGPSHAVALGAEELAIDLRHLTRQLPFGPGQRAQLVLDPAQPGLLLGGQLEAAGGLAVTKNGHCGQARGHGPAIAVGRADHGFRNPVSGLGREDGRLGAQPLVRFREPVAQSGRFRRCAVATFMRRQS